MFNLWVSIFVWKTFTFQSGSIQINEKSFRLVTCFALYIPIWFYSNETIRQTQPNYLFSLHSNLVLFKWCNGRRCNRSAYLYIPIWFYSNNVKQMFEFHKISLYIPIWFYSNSKTAEGNFFWTYLYIPIWFYSNRKRTWLQFYLCSLYIPIWFYSNST